MIEKYWLEFSKIYARLMRLELTIKHNAYLAIKEHNDKNALNEFIKFFQNKRRQQRYTNDRKNKLDYIINHPQKTQLQKMKLLINELYLSDMLNLILKTTQFKIKEIDEIFYNKIPKKYIELENCIKPLTFLRNCIAHYNFKLYKDNKTLFLDSLFLFEVHLGHNIAGIAQLPKFKNKPSIKEIVQEIYNLKPELIADVHTKCSDESKTYYCNQHRMLLSLFDDICIYNGISANDLPSPWTILRELYRFQSEIKPKLQTI